MSGVGIIAYKIDVPCRASAPCLQCGSIGPVLGHLWFFLSNSRVYFSTDGVPWAQPRATVVSRCTYMYMYDHNVRPQSTQKARVAESYRARGQRAESKDKSIQVPMGATMSGGPVILSHT